MWFGEFFDATKSAEENKQQSDKAKHNAECLRSMQVAFGVVATLAGAAVGLKKVYNEFFK